MALRFPPQIGQRRGPYKRRFGVDFPTVGGMYLQGTPATCPPGTFRHLENVGFEDDGIFARGGQIKINDVPLHDPLAKIQSLYDFQTVGNPLRLYMGCDGCPGIDNTLGGSISWVDADQSPSFQRGVYYSSLPASASVVMTPFDGHLFLGLNDELKGFVLISLGWGQEALAVGGQSQEQPVLRFTGFVVRCLKTFDGLLFIGLDAGVGASKIHSWDGLAERADLTGINAPTGFALWRDRLVVGFGSATNHIRTRVVGASPGTWTTVNPAAGTIAFVYGKSYKDILYIVDGVNSVWSYDGTTLQVVRTVAGATKMRGLATFGGYLYYGYQSAANHAVVGRFDGTTWTDAHKDLTAQSPTVLYIRTMEEYRSDLWAAVIRSTAQGDLFSSPGLVTSGTWVDRLPASLSSVGDFGDMEVF